MNIKKIENNAVRKEAKYKALSYRLRIYILWSHVCEFVNR